MHYPINEEARSAITAEIISQYLEQTITEQPLPSGQSMPLPSLTHLAETYEVTRMDILESLHILRRKGYDYRLEGLDDPIILWHA